MPFTLVKQGSHSGLFGSDLPRLYEGVYLCGLGSKTSFLAALRRAINFPESFFLSPSTALARLLQERTHIVLKMYN